jgi:hypothetical protein
MSVIPSIVMLAVEGTRREDGKLMIGEELFDGFPRQIIVEGRSFDLTEEEEIDADTRYCLGHYFSRGPADGTG